VVDEALGIALGPDGRLPLVVTRELDPDAVELNTDPGLLRQILINLFTNAADAVAHRTGEGPGHLAVSARVADGAVELAVRDDGVGIAAEDVARIFEPFYTTKGRGKGTGLGLAICRELVSALQGKISVESAPGKGSVFRLVLPRDAATPDLKKTA
jgi:two-component system NtrC family sensor kinase